ncbi:hypothetical protein [Paenibacillus sp. 1001270B_150601_E10]|uniref:hypothetical protein n=1 Tax=Paenibacillus sp. 1001270B_150601_E10 TaxID=2787079 RepID=UPI0018A0222F|nr:hypothetical protein [Paenibacillus sp. 1001270B_150601_E10]
MSRKAKRDRRKLEREHALNPEIRRTVWQRKPFTQAVPNKKAEQRRSMCRRKGHDDSAVFRIMLQSLHLSF